ncbi:YhgE/Pip domain-containing protein [Stackebrandtia nassauensis]|uniref:YhgE/Pip N-terminal domain protein n=1 Tax=Stackebrandtia nassauensis (strain DSM 44728 / CIP 108903 / NRRL B-16338 / NBRC 102104 / LLR-40K-21) TaxID=446470 RepID=D3PY40_STANL|nr:YhgE/Pip domain-containing protein [Stackebrandtia nassauensis]ADD45369.1 YhgE/Pip N-terminal domain protein [Stackebrandtia nassauensis DSM 44728]
MFKPFADSARAIASGPLTWKTWTGLITVPVLILSLLTWAYWSPGADHGTATAAIVNDDKPVKVNGQTIPLGRQLAGILSHSEDSAYRWVLTDADDAEAGLADGGYAATVTIPEDFSRRATSTATQPPLDAARATLRVRTSDATGAADPRLVTAIATATQDSLDNQIVETYLDNIYVAFTTIHDKLGEAADGASQLADGTSQLSDGAGELADGAAQLDTATAELSRGADQLASGTGELADGSAQLSSGLSQAERDTAQLPRLTQRLADGAEQVAQGNEQLASVVVPLANRIIDAIDALPSAREAAREFRRLADDCAAGGGSPGFCRGLDRAADRFETNAGKLDGARETIRQAAVDARDAVRDLASGARQVADGNATLASRAGELAGGIASAADGARQLDSGIQQADTGARQLATGAGRLSTGAGNLSTGADQLSDGAKEVDDGARELASGLNQVRDQVPSYTKDERAHLKTVAADPTDADASRTGIGPLALTLFVAMALWALALATYIVTRAVPAAVLTARAATWRIILRTAVPGSCAAVLAALALTVIAVPVLGLGIMRALGFGAVALLAALTFVSLNQAAVAIFGRAGRLASLTVLLLTAATGVISTLPSPLYAVAGYLPTHAATLALRGTVTDTHALMLTGTVQLAAWLAVGTLATIVITDRRRYLSTRQLRRGTVLPAAT